MKKIKPQVNIKVCYSFTCPMCKQKNKFWNIYAEILKCINCGERYLNDKDYSPMCHPNKFEVGN